MRIICAKQHPLDYLEIETNTTQQVFGARQLAAFIDLNTYSRAGTEWPWASTKPLEQKRNVETSFED